MNDAEGAVTRLLELLHPFLTQLRERSWGTDRRGASMIDREPLEGDPSSRGGKSVLSTARAPFDANSGCREACFLSRRGPSSVLSIRHAGKVG